MRPGVLIAVLLGLALAACAPRAARPTPPPAREPPRAERPVPRHKPLEPPAPRPKRTYVGEGLASFYGPGLHGRRTASGERFNQHALTAAHRQLRFGTCLRVLNMENGKDVQVRVNDRGPYAPGRIIDLSKAAARKLGMLDDGLVRVRLYRCSDWPPPGRPRAGPGAPERSR